MRKKDEVRIIPITTNGDVCMVKTRKVFGRKIGCKRCGRKRGIVRRYRIHLCRQCFRDVAEEIGFKKYS